MNWEKLWQFLLLVNKGWWVRYLWENLLHWSAWATCEEDVSLPADPLQDLAQHGVWVFYLPAQSWTVHNALSYVRHTLLEAALVYMALIFVNIQCFCPDYHWWFFWEAPICLGAKQTGLPAHFSCVESRHKALFDEVFWNWCSGSAGFCQLWRTKAGVTACYLLQSENTKALQCVLSQLPSVKIRGVRKSVKFIHWKELERITQRDLSRIISVGVES